MSIFNLLTIITDVMFITAIVNVLKTDVSSSNVPYLLWPTYEAVLYLFQGGFFFIVPLLCLICVISIELYDDSV